jgi:hypothetical protein
METITIKLGETTTLKAADVLKDKKKLAEKLEGADCRWHVAGGAVVAKSDLEDDDTLEIIGAQVGRSRISYGPSLHEQELGNKERFAASAPTNQVEFDVVVEEVRETVAPTMGLDSSAANGLLPMDEVQEEASEKSPYGLDQDNKPVAPTASMSAPDLSNVARQSEDAEATGPQDEAKENDAEGEKADGDPEATEGKSLRGKLPEDFPGRAALEAEGVTTYAGVRKQMNGDGLTAVPNIGDATAAKIEEAMGVSGDDEES